jgi:hypothetical protein
MLVQGQIIAIIPPDYSDNYGNQYQNITVRTAQGDIQGRKASKQALTENDINRQVEWNCEQAQSRRGVYNKFTKLQDPQYASQNQQQGTQQARQGTNAPQSAPHSNRDASICRQTAGKVAAEILASSGADSIGQTPNETAALLVSVAKPIAEWFLTGKEPMVASQYKTNPDYVGDGQEGICPHCQKLLEDCICDIKV